jgi:hypothetical protein
LASAAFAVVCALPIVGLCQERIGAYEWTYAYADTGKTCDPYYSLLPPQQKCIDGRLMAIRYKVRYLFQGKTYEKELDYLPEKNAVLDDAGNPTPRNLTATHRD